MRVATRNVCIALSTLAERHAKQAGICQSGGDEQMAREHAVMAEELASALMAIAARTSRKPRRRRHATS